MKRKIHLGFNLSSTHHNGRWNLPGAWGDRVFPDVTLYEDVARIAERGLVDFLFSGDGTGVPDTWGGNRDAAVHWGIYYPRVDMAPFMAAMSRVTKHIGFGVTFSTTFMHPYYLARLIASLDLLTQGRIALNLVTSTRRTDAANYGFDELMEHSRRYDRMEEFVKICDMLWNATEPGAVVWNRETGQMGDPSKVHNVVHKGEFFKVEGPLNTPPLTGGRPVIVQAGGSVRGTEAAAGFTDYVFGGDMPLIGQCRQREALDKALVAAGRSPEGVGIFWQTPIAVRETQAEADAVRESLRHSLTPEGAAVYLSYNEGFDFSNLPKTFRLDELRDEIAAANATPNGLVYRLMLKFGEDTEMTRKDFFEQALLAVSQYENTISGTPDKIADILEERFEATGSRGGFMIGQAISVMDDITAVADLLVPELQRRGRYRTAYTGRTLRENMADS